MSNPHTTLQQANTSLSANVIREARGIASKSEKHAQVVIRKMDARVSTVVSNSGMIIKRA